MATRINVTAVRGVAPAEVRAAMSQVHKPVCQTDDCQPLGDLLQLTEHGGWVSFTTSVWGVSANDLNRGLCQLARPAVQFTTSDGSRWYLTVHGGPLGQVHFTHEFGVLRADPDPSFDSEQQAHLERPEEPPDVDPALAFLEEDRPPARQRGAFDLITDALGDLGSVPDEVRAEIDRMPYSRAVARFRRWYADQVMAALVAAGIPCDEAAARRALLWEGLTETERYSDLGNLPRLLAALGLGGQWDDYIRQAEAPPEPPEQPVEEAAPEPTPELIEPVLRLAGAVPLAAVDGGPVPLPIKKLGLVSFLPEALSVEANAGAVLAITLPPGSERRADEPPPGYSDSQLVLTDDGFRLGLEDGGNLDWSFLKGVLGKSLTKWLTKPADGTVLDVAFAAEGHPALLQRYRGRTAGDQWRIEETYPPLTTTALAGALELARLRDKERFPLQDEAEVAAIEAQARLDPNLHGGKFNRDGLTGWFDYDFNGGLAKALFRHRHGAAWDLASYEREAAAKIAEQVRREREMRRSLAAAARQRAAPHDAAVLFRGQHGPYWRSDFAQLTDLEQETRQKWDAALAALGLHHLGDLVAKKQRDIVLRVHAAADGSCYGVLMAKRTMYLGYEFVTRFADGSMLTTTTNSTADSVPEAGIYYKHCPGLTPEALFEKHRWGVAQFQKHKATTPAALPQSLLGVAEELDAAFVKRAAFGPTELVSVETIPLEVNGAEDD